jgi:NADPH:quinone reductase-like Zn-dependent oxidoreductase
MQACEIRQFGIKNLTLVERVEPQPEANDVVVKFRAASLNHRDLMFIKGVYNPKTRLPAVPFSDGSCELGAVRPNAKK